MEIKRIGVAGAGTMGAGIAQVSASIDHQVVLFDINEDQLEVAKANIEKNLEGAIKRGKIDEETKNKTISNIEFTSDLSQLKADLVIEAIIEKLSIKQDLFLNLNEINGEDCILATNTSTIPITQIAYKIPSPERVVGMHFFNPVHIMKLVEVIEGAATDPKISALIFDLALKMGKKPVMAKDAPGFIVNRVARHFYVESLKVLEENVANHEDIDALVESIGFRMGPFKLMDLIGVETNFAVTSSMYDLFKQDAKFRPSRIQEQKVQAGYFGRKTKKGFYEYE